MKRSLVYVGLLLISFQLFCAPVDSSRAKKVAKLFYEKQFYRFTKQKINAEVRSIYPYQYQNETAFYIISINPQGFVIVSADDIAFPILGYSFENEIIANNLPEALNAYIIEASKQIIHTKHIHNSTYEAIWRDIEEKPLSKVTFSTYAIPPLLNLKWDQGVPYNKYCPPHPKGPGGRCLTGCVATAMAMVMKYHNYPERGKGIKTFYWTEWDTIDYENTYYRWNQMTVTANSQSADAIAELMYHCGVSVNMDYGPYASGSFTFWIPNAMKNYFRYHPQIRYFRRDQFFDYEWDMMIRDELTYKRPVIYSGSGTGGHAFVCDGFQDTCFYHFNWGWSGYGNGYYYYNDLTPGNNDFSYGQGAVVYIMPYFGNYCVENFLLTDTARSFNDGSGLSYYWNNTSCSWLIKPRNGQNIWLYFNKFQTEPNYDILYIYDGQNEQAPLIGAFSGYSLPPTITSTGNSLFLKFVTNETIQGQGWEAYYATSPVHVENMSFEQTFNIYPNPAHESLTIETTKHLQGTYEILNFLGQTISKGNFYQKTSIRVDHLPTGLYHIRIYSGNESFIRKITILR